MENKQALNQRQNKKTQPSQEEVQNILNSLDPKKLKLLLEAFISKKVETKTFSGPLPAPEDFAAYKNVVPDAPERILAMAEKQQQHRIDTERKIVDWNIKSGLLGQLLAAIIAIVCLLCCVYLGIHGHDVLAGSIVAIIVSVVTIFALRKRSDQKKEK